MLEIMLEPTANAYRNLVRLAVTDCATFSLVVRPGFKLQPSALEMLDALRPWSVDTAAVHEWPGTTLGKGVATLHRFRATTAVEPVLERVGRLYGWIHPEYPEDLAFYTQAGAVWLGSCAHEAIAWFDAVDRPQGELEQHIPGLPIRRRRGKA